jgi:septum formation protein
MSEVILASASPRREELLRLMGIDFRVARSNFDESTVLPWPPDEHVMTSAAGKAGGIAASLRDGLVIGADTVVVVDDQILGKPADPADAARMLRLLSGRSHYVYTGLCVVERVDCQTARTLLSHERTEVLFGPLPNDIIDAYVATGEPLDKAGAYGIQERGSVLVEGIVGDYFNVVGLPIYRLTRMLLELGIPLFPSQL